MKYDSSFDKNIGFFVVETSNIKYTSWPGHLNLMDEIWVPCNSMIRDGFANGITKPMKLVPHTFDMEEYKKKYDRLNLPVANKFTFYFIGEFNRRKHISALIKAFHTEFSIEEPVELVLKVNKYGTSPEQLGNEIKSFCNSIKDGLKLYKDPSRYKPEIIITVDISREDMLRLHSTCDCFVAPSYGEAWCTIPETEVLTNNNYKPIISIKKDDLVLTHTGKYETVTKTLCRQYDGEMYILNIKGIADELHFTKGHQHYIVPRNNQKFHTIELNPIFTNVENIKNNDLIAIPKIKKDNSYLDLEYIQISDFVDVVLDGENNIVCNHSYNNKPQLSLHQIADKFNCAFQTVGKAINHKSNSKLAKSIREFVKTNTISTPTLLKIPNKIHLTPEFMFFIGHYIAEGCSDISHVCLSTHKNENFGRTLSKKAIKQAFNIDTTKEIYKNNSSNLIFNNKIIGQFLQILCGKNCYEKHIPIILKRSKHIGCLIHGIFYGDGHFSKMGQIKFSTTSKQLKYDLIEIFNINNIFCNYSKRMNKNIGYTIQPIQQHIDRVFNFIQPYKYNIKLTCPKFAGQKFLLEDNNYFYVPINTINTYQYKGMVYNISVKNDESYVVYGCATHNCIPAWEAMAMGKLVIASATGGMLDYIDSERNGFLVGGSMEPVFGQMDTFEEFGTAREKWFDISTHRLMDTMRRVYELSSDRKQQISIEAKSSTQKYGYEPIGNIIKNLLEL
jgi:glycosyltransferase involved in cell wall biosynthesis